MSADQYLMQKQCCAITYFPIYTVIETVRDEAAFIKRTILALIRQTVLPLKRVLVIDGSKDGSSEIVERFALRYRLIELIRMPQRADRHFE